MILFWVHAAGGYVINRYLENRGRPLADCMRTCLYEDITPVLELSAGPHIFGALDKLTEAQRDAAASIYDQLATLQPTVPVLNDPRRVLLRYPLLRKLFESGVNSFRAFRATRATEVRRFPVFVREESRHSGTRTPLLHSRVELARALFSMRARGYRLRDLLVVEFCDTSDRHGIFRKYAAFKVGDHIIPAHVMAGRHWMMKSESNEPDANGVREALDYVENNPHEPWLRQVFSLANIDYGRIDYSMAGSVPQVWEINLNPTIGRRRGSQRVPMSPEIEALRDRRGEIFHSALRSAFRRLDRETTSSSVCVSTEPGILARVRVEAAAAERRVSRMASLHRIYEHSWAGRPLRLLYSRVVPRL